MLALRDTKGSYTTEPIRQHLLEGNEEYRSSMRLAFFICDSASNNDKALELLPKHMQLQLSKQPLRCTGHVTNLVSKSILFGVDTDCFDDVCSATDNEQYDNLTDAAVSRFERSLCAANEVSQLQRWRRKGPIGKLHNVIIHATRKPFETLVL